METIMNVTCGILLVFLLLVGGAVLGMSLVTRAILKEAENRRKLPQGYRWVDENRLVEECKLYLYDLKAAAAAGSLAPISVELFHEKGYQDFVPVHMSGTQISEIGVPNKHGRVAVFLQDQVLRNSSDPKVELRMWMLDPNFMTLEAEQVF